MDEMRNWDEAARQAYRDILRAAEFRTADGSTPIAHRAAAVYQVCEAAGVADLCDGEDAATIDRLFYAMAAAARLGKLRPRDLLDDMRIAQVGASWPHDPEEEQCSHE